MTPDAQPIEILLVEDNPGDVRLTKELLHEAKVLNHLTVASDGEQALDLLRAGGASPYRPDLILLDLNLPRKTGHEVLEVLKGDDSLRTIPVIVLTTSDAENDVRRSYHLHANGYIVKPVDLDQFVRSVQAIESFWLMAVRLPHQGRA